MHANHGFLITTLICKKKKVRKLLFTQIIRLRRTSKIRNCPSATAEKFKNWLQLTIEENLGS